MKIKSFLGKHEFYTILILTAILFFISIFIFFGNPFSQSYYKNIDVKYKYENGFLNVEEKFEININTNSYNVVYRDFDYTIILLKEKNLGNSYINNNVFIEKVECSIGKAYISKSSKQNNIYDGISHNSISLSSLIKNKIEDNEVGCYNEDGYKSTENEILTIKYSISEEDLNLNNYIHFFFSKSHFPIYKINVEGENFKISSSFLYKDVPVKINTKTGDFGIYKQISTYFVFVFIFLPMFLWLLFGMEKKHTVPSYLHNPPNPQRTPWEASLFVRNQLRLSKEGFSVLLFTLKNKNIIDINERKALDGKLRILIKKDIDFEKLDELEKAFINVCLVYGGIKDKKILSKKTQLKITTPIFSIANDSDRCEIKEDWIVINIINSDKKLGVFNEVYNGPVVKNFEKEVLTKPISKYILYAFYFILPIIYIFFIITNTDIIGILFYIYIFLGGFILALIPSSLFRKFRKDYYKEYLEWIAFENFLGDFAQLKRYGQDDVNLFNSWMYYGIALGVAEKVLKAMKNFNIDPKIIESYSRNYSMTHSFSNSFSKIGASGSGGGSGGAGGGGGSGGGGGGGR